MFGLDQTSISGILGEEQLTEEAILTIELLLISKMLFCLISFDIAATATQY